MTETIQFQSRVGIDGVLDIHVPLGEMDAGTDVLVTIRCLRPASKQNMLDRSEWRRQLDNAYGSCANMGLERAAQGQLEIRETVE